MKEVYPVVISKGETYLVVDVPDFTISTQGENLLECIEMARDAISLTGISMEDRQIPLPSPSPLSGLEVENLDDIVTLVDVDFVAYRRANEKQTTSESCSIPMWLHREAEKAGVDFSALLQSAIMSELHLT